jgi:hypothetical protein
VNEHGIWVAVVFHCSEKRNSDAKDNKRTLSSEATAYAKALALVACGAWHLLFSDQRSLLPEQISKLQIPDYIFQAALRAALQITHPRLQNFAMSIWNLKFGMWNRSLASRVYDCPTALRIWRMVSA